MKPLLTSTLYPARLLLAFGATFAATVAFAAVPVVDVYKNPACGCCGKWVEHLKQNGFEVKVHEMADVSSERQRLGMREQLASCHTAKVGNYVVEGHVPAQDIQRLQREHPKALGLAVPSMPSGTPGMGGNGHYDVLLVQAGGATRTYAHY